MSYIVKYNIIAGGVGVLLSLCLFIPEFVFSSTSTPSSTVSTSTSTPSSTVSTSTSTPSSTVSTPIEYVELKNPIAGLEGASGQQAIAAIIGRIILQAMTVAGSIALVAFIVGALVWMTSGGKSDKVQMGAKIMLSATIGLFIIFSAYGILDQIINAIT